MVSSYAIDDDERRLLLLDPLAPPSEIDQLAAEREPAIVLTCPRHARDAESLAERLGAALYVPPPDEGDSNPLEGQVLGPATGCRSESRRSTGWSRTISCSGSRPTGRSSPATR